MSKNTVTQEKVNEILNKSEVEYQKFGNKTLVGVCTLPNGFILVEDASCVDPANFSEEIGKGIITERFSNKVWELEGYKLQSELGEKSNLRVAVDVKGIDAIQDLAKVMRKFADDPRTPVGVREEFMDQVNEILEVQKIGGCTMD
ncbi:Gp49 family protein [Bacillus sp. V3B]|uniref:Gp49 family protein n=1 Tax=Bacillus sp. V3B TaxID=2804915 RepID=UPI002108B058|nr:Gp49 family protein [Bacillus sp. V3B]